MSNYHDGLLDQFFDWKEWNELPEAGDLVYYQIVLKTQIGQFMSGTKFDSAYFIASQSLLVFQNSFENYEFPIFLSVGGKCVTFERQNLSKNKK